MSELAEIRLWDTRIGAVQMENDIGIFQYDKDFLSSHIEVSPLMMPLNARPYRFPELLNTSFHGLPGLVADSLPDSFGNAVINEWLSRQGKQASSFSPIDRLCYTGTRGMGALEFFPLLENPKESSVLHLESLVELASQVMTNRNSLSVQYDPKNDETNSKAFTQILQVGSSAGGARAKAIIAYNPKTQEIRSGQVQAPEGFEYWLLKFDGVTNNGDKGFVDGKGFGLVEYAYYLMAQNCSLIMSKCRLLPENGRNHFMTKRFDRTDAGQKIHMQSLGSLAHFDYNLPGAYSYEQAFQVMERLQLDKKAVEQFFRRMAFNIITRNQDDHVKNISFLMNRQGVWSLAPAYDVTFSFNSESKWVRHHQMSMNGKTNDFTLEDFKECGKAMKLVRGRAESIVKDIEESIRKWPEIASQVGISEQMITYIQNQFRIF